MSRGYHYVFKNKYLSKVCAARRVTWPKEMECFYPI